MSQRMDFEIISMLYKALNGLTLEYISSILVGKGQKRCLRSSNGSIRELPRTYNKYGDRDFSAIKP